MKTQITENTDDSVIHLPPKPQPVEVDPIKGRWDQTKGRVIGWDCWNGTPIHEGGWEKVTIAGTQSMATATSTGKS
jgi:hypothetical protein